MNTTQQDQAISDELVQTFRRNWMLDRKNETRELIRSIIFHVNKSMFDVAAQGAHDLANKIEEMRAEQVRQNSNV